MLKQILWRLIWIVWSPWVCFARMGNPYYKIAISNIITSYKLTTNVYSSLLEYSQYTVDSTYNKIFKDLKIQSSQNSKMKQTLKSINFNLFWRYSTLHNFGKIGHFIQTPFMLTTQDDHNLCCQRVARLEGQTSTGYDWERALKVYLVHFCQIRIGKC